MELAGEIAAMAVLGAAYIFFIGMAVGLLKAALGAVGEWRAARRPAPLGMRLVQETAESLDAIHSDFETIPIRTARHGTALGQFRSTGHIWIEIDEALVEACEHEDEAIATEARRVIREVTRHEFVHALAYLKWRDEDSHAVDYWFESADELGAPGDRNTAMSAELQRHLFQRWDMEEVLDRAIEEGTA
jgi:hypothetical protein